MTARVAIAGTGAIAGTHARALRAQGRRVRRVAAADVQADRLERFCDEHRIPGRYADVTQMLEVERPDLVHICTPPGTHADLAIQCLAAGAWVLCEKPLCGSLAELDRIEAAEAETGRFCVSVVQWRFGSAARHLKWLLEIGTGGRPLLGLCQTTWYRDRAYYAVPWRGRWESELGGVTVGQGIHAIDFFLWLLGDWREVSGMLGTLDHEIAVEDVSVAGVRFESGAIGSIVNSVLSPRQETRLRFDLQGATFELACLYGYRNRDWKCTPAPGHDEVQAAWARIPGKVPASHKAQVGAVLDAYEQGRRPPASSADVRPTIEFLSSLYKAAATATPVSRGSVLPGDPFYQHAGGTLALSHR